MKHRKDVCVIGGGVMGLTVAYYLCNAGKSVTLAEKKEIGAGASGSCDDMILLQSKQPGIMLKLALESVELYKGIGDELGYDIGFESRGGSILIENDAQLRVMEHFVRLQTENGLHVKIIGQKDLQKMHPMVSNRIIASTYSREDSQVDPLRLMHALLGNCLRSGMEILRPSAAIDIAQKGDHWNVILSNGDAVECDYVVNAAGAWAPEIGALTGKEIPIIPLKGQLVVTEQIASLGKSNFWSALYVASKLDKSLLQVSDHAKKIGLGFSCAQTYDGNYLIGSTREHAGFDKTTTMDAITTIVNQAKTFFPIFEKVNIIRTIAGFRPASTDGKPIVCPVDGQDGMYLAAGHEGDGIALAPITGRAVAGMILGRHTDERFDQLNLRRFNAKSENTKVEERVNV